MKPNPHDPLRLNVGFLLHESVGFSRTFDFDISTATVGGDLNVRRLRGELQLTRTAQGLYTAGQLTAEIPGECARCLEPIEQRLSPELAELFVYPAEKADDPLLAIPESGVVDLNPLLREVFLLELPLQPVCKSDCQGLCPVCGVNRNHDQCQHPQEEIDPRMAPLKSLLSDS